MDSLEKKLVLCLVIALLIVAFIPFYWLREPARQAAATTRIQKESVQKGRDTFVTTCSSCHGQQAQGGAGPSLKGKDATLVQKTVRNGKGIMPVFSPNQISDGELEDIIAFLGSLLSSQSPAAPPQTPPVATVVPPTTSPAPTSAAPATPATPPAPKAGDLLSKGEDLFQRKASGVGCAGCHGVDAYGAIGPNIRGSSAQEITEALKTVASMNFIKLTNDEVEAISAYLKYLESQR
ncbi:MAG: c-type cytochrome [Dehalococcoidales bacterium]|nr:c-type cytochrome [Dehalococcoidales bacterium]